MEEAAGLTDMIKEGRGIEVDPTNLVIQAGAGAGIGLRGPPTPPHVLAHPDPARPPIDPVSYAMVSAVSLPHT
eukprot:1006887-Pelagomonas_calceolata.AAC.3